MHIAFDLNSVLVHRYSGFFTYGAGLLQGFTQLPDPPRFTFFYSHKLRRHASWLGPIVRGDVLVHRVTRLKMRHLAWWWRHVPWPTLKRFVGPFDLYQCNHHLMPPTGRCPRVLVVHDLRRYRYPQFYRHSKLGPFEAAVRGADHFIAISAATKADLCHYFAIDPDRVTVVHHGGPVELAAAAQAAARDGAQRLCTPEAWGLQPRRYFVLFGSYDPRKNLPTMIRAFAQARPRLADDYRLVLLGNLPRPETVFPDDLDEATRDRIVCTGGLPDVASLLAGSTALVYASLYEGFGLPILEAMRAGTAVVTSNVSSMPEVAGEAALLADPQDTAALAAAMVRLAGDDAERARRVEAGRQRAAEFSWPRAAAETLAVYRRVLGLD